jgi:aldehyde:ferredoxin oxidoreductase
LKLPKVNPHDYHNKGELHRVYSSWQHIINAGGICWFGSFCVFFPVVDLLNAITGWDTDVDELLATGTRILLMRHAFNLREGFRPSAFQLPPRVAGEPPLSEGPLKGTTIDMKTLKAGAYGAMGCDPDTGFFSRETLVRFGLDQIVGEEWTQG